MKSPFHTMGQAAFFASLAGATQFNLTNFNGELSDTGVLRSLSPANSTFDFQASDYWVNLTADGVYHTGDLNLRWKGENGRWQDASTAFQRNLSFTDLDADIQSWDLTPAYAGSGLNVTRTWSNHDGDLVLTFNVTNANASAVTIGGLGMPLTVNNIFSHRSGIDTINTCSFIEPYIGLDAGYAQVASLTGEGPNMLITPYTTASKLEAWNFLYQNSSTWLGYQASAAYEGNFAWQVYTGGFSTAYWDGVDQWNPPTTVTLQPGQSETYGVRFTYVNRVENIEATLMELNRPVAVGLPSYVLPSNGDGSLYLSYGTPTSMKVHPQDALSVGSLDFAPKAPWKGYSITPGTSFFGRADITITYDDGLVQTIHYWITEPTATAIQKVGEFISGNQWYTNVEEPFRRAPSFMTFDRTADTFVLQDLRVWIAGLVDEAGAGPWVQLALKQVIQPDSGQVAKLEQFVNETVWGQLQISSGNGTYGVHRCLFYYEPTEFPQYTYIPEYNFAAFSAMGEAACDHVDRTFNYVWVSILYWSLYKVNRVSPGITTVQTPDWYLRQSAETVKFAYSNNSAGLPWTSSTEQGLMGSSLWGMLIQDLQNENMDDEAQDIIEIQRGIQAHWASIPAPYGSEQAWDCTAQESVYYWSMYFNDTATANKTVNSVHGYDFAIPHWGYNGNARRYWDFTTAGEFRLSRIERQIHHYGSPFNSIPLLDWYRFSQTPGNLDDIYNLRVGYGGHSAAISNIGSDGFGSMAFHAWPDTLKWDNYTGDYGPSFVGHFLSASSFLVEHPDFGWHAFGGNLQAWSDGTLCVYPTGSPARRLFIAPLGLDVQFEAGTISKYTYNAQSGDVEVCIEDVQVNTTILMYSANIAQVTLNGNAPSARGGFEVNVPGSVSFSSKSS